MVGRSPSTVWRLVNAGRETTRTQVELKQRFALVCKHRFVDHDSIRRIAAALSVSRSAVERDLRRARDLEAMGFDREQILDFAVVDAFLRRSGSAENVQHEERAGAC